MSSQEGIIIRGGVGVMKNGLSVKKEASTRPEDSPIGMSCPEQSGSSTRNNSAPLNNASGPAQV